MPTYVITGVYKGLGFELLRQLTSKAENTVIGLVRNKSATEKKVSEELKDAAGKIHIMEADIDSYDSLKNAAAETATITGGAIDYLIANAALMTPGHDFFKNIGAIADEPEKLEADLSTMIKTNVVGNIYLFNLFMPLILRGDAKKVIFISTGMSDIGFSTKLEIEVSSLYTITKAAMNNAVTKFSAQYKKDGVLFLSICPGVISHSERTDHSELTEAEIAQGMALFRKFGALSDGWTGPATPADAIKDVIKVWEDASIEKGHAGLLLPHTGIPGKWVTVNDRD